MFAIHLLKNYESLRALGLVGSRRQYARLWLGRGPHYLRDIANRDRGWRRLPPTTPARLHANLKAVAANVPVGIAEEIIAVLHELDRDAMVAHTMDGWGR